MGRGEKGKCSAKRNTSGFPVVFLNNDAIETTLKSVYRFLDVREDDNFPFLLNLVPSF